MLCCVCDCQKRTDSLLKNDYLTADYCEVLRRPPIWSSKQIKTLHGSFFPFFQNPNLRGSASSTNNRCISSDRKLNHPTLGKERRGVNGGFFERGWSNDAAHLGCFEEETEVLLFGFECVPVMSRVLYSCLISLACNETTNPPHPGIPLSLFIFGY